MSRGFFAASLLVAVAGFAFFNLLLAPVIEAAMIPTKELRAHFVGARVLPDLHFPEVIPIYVAVTVRDYPLTELFRNFDIHFFRAMGVFLQTEGTLFNSSSLMSAALQEAISVRGVLPPPYGRPLCPTSSAS